MSCSLICRRDPGACQKPSIPTLHRKKLTSQHVLVKLFLVIITKSYIGRIIKYMFPAFFPPHQSKLVYLHPCNKVVTGSLAIQTSPIMNHLQCITCGISLQGNPHYQSQVYKALVALLSSTSSEAQRMAAYTLRLIQVRTLLLRMRIS